MIDNRRQKSEASDRFRPLCISSREHLVRTYGPLDGGPAGDHLRQASGVRFWRRQVRLPDDRRQKPASRGDRTRCGYFMPRLRGA